MNTTTNTTPITYRNGANTVHAPATITRDGRTFEPLTAFSLEWVAGCFARENGWKRDEHIVHETANVNGEPAFVFYIPAK